MGKKIAEETRLNTQYAKEMAYADGTIVEDHIGYARIIRYNYYSTYTEFPTPVYYCENLTKKFVQQKKKNIEMFITKIL